MESKNKKVVVSICSDLNAARIQTPYTNELVETNDLIHALGRAYSTAQDEKDEKAMQDIHNVRQTITKAHA